MSRGRGRGRGKGISRSGLLEGFPLPAGERLPPPILTPPPPYPPLERRPLEMKMTEGEKYIVALKQELREYMAGSPFFVSGRGRTGKNAFVPTSYEVLFGNGKFVANGGNRGEVFPGWSPDWSLFPAELKPDLSKKKRKAAHPPSAKKLKLDIPQQEFSQTLIGDSDNVVQSKQEQVGEDDKEEEGEENQEEEAVEYDEEEEEEEGDYTANYFDDGGEDYGGDEDDALEDKDGPCY